jgi:hypothetical protein
MTAPTDAVAADERIDLAIGGMTCASCAARVDLGLALGTGTDVAIEASDLTLVRGDLRAAADAIRLARRTLSTIRGKPLLGVRLQRRRSAARSLGPTEPHDRRGRHGSVQRVRRHQQPATAPLPLGHRVTPPPLALGGCEC